MDKDYGNVHGELKKAGTRMRPPVQSVYNRQVAKCLDDIHDMQFDMPNIVVDRIKKAIEFTCKDVDKLKNKNPNGGNYGTGISGNR